MYLNPPLVLPQYGMDILSSVPPTCTSFVSAVIVHELVYTPLRDVGTYMYLVACRYICMLRGTGGCASYVHYLLEDSKARRCLSTIHVPNSSNQTAAKRHRWLCEPEPYSIASFSPSCPTCDSRSPLPLSSFFHFRFFNHSAYPQVSHKVSPRTLALTCRLMRASFYNCRRKPGIILPGMPAATSNSLY